MSQLLIIQGVQQMGTDYNKVNLLMAVLEKEPTCHCQTVMLM